MAPTLHSGLIHYGGKLKSLVRGKQNIILPQKEEENTLQNDFHEQGRETKQDHTNPAPIKHVLRSCTQPTLIHSKGTGGEDSGECHTQSRASQKAAQNLRISKGFRNHHLFLFLQKVLRRLAQSQK